MADKEIVGTVVGITNPREFYFTITPGKVQLQELVAIDAFKIDSSGEKRDETMRVWAKVADIERINPLFPEEAAQELAYQRMSAFDTVISMSREMITAKCKVLGIEDERGELQPLTYPLQPASSVYIAEKNDIETIMTGNCPDYRKLNIGHLRNRSEFDVFIDGHSIVARHLAVLATTGAGKTVAVRRIIEELIKKNYPILIFDPAGDYVGLKDTFPQKITIYNPMIDLASEGNDTILRYISDFSGEKITDAQSRITDGLLEILRDNQYKEKIRQWAAKVQKEYLGFSLKDNHFWAIMNLCKSLLSLKGDKSLWEKEVNPYINDKFPTLAKFDDRSLYAIIGMANRSGKLFNAMLKANKALTRNLGEVKLLPSTEKLRELIAEGNVSVINFEGYNEEIRQSIVASILNQLVEDRIDGNIKRFLTVVEEAHNFIPSGEQVSSSPIIRRIATEGRKYGMGLILISQRPYRVEPTIISQCNSFIILKIINPADQQYIRQVVETIGEDETKILPDLATGEALVSGECVRFPMLVKIAMPESKGRHEEEDFIKDFASEPSLF